MQQWDERRKKAIIRDYYKELNKSTDERPANAFNNDTITTTKPKK